MPDTYEQLLMRSHSVRCSQSGCTFRTVLRYRGYHYSDRNYVSENRRSIEMWEVRGEGGPWYYSFLN